MPLNIIFRVDSSSAMGMGHLVRCITLASALQRRGVNCSFYCRDLPGIGTALLDQAGLKVTLLQSSEPSNTDPFCLDIDQDAAETIKSLQELSPDWVITDHYGIDANWHRQVRKSVANLKVLAIDDLANRPHECDMLLDLSPGRAGEDYIDLLSSHSSLMLGLDYALIIPEFSKYRKARGRPQHQAGDPTQILVTLGGGKHHVAVEKVLGAINAVSVEQSIKTTILGTVEKSTLEAFSPIDIQHIEFSNDMAALMNQSDLVICAGGGTNWERCCLGIPGIVLQLAENQTKNIDEIVAAGAGKNCPLETVSIRDAICELLSDPHSYQQMAKNAWEMCDGFGAQRVANAIVAKSLEFTASTPKDARFIYDARYSDGASNYYKNPDVPEYADHLNWYKAALNSGLYRFFCVRLGSEIVAHVRLDIDQTKPNVAEIGIALGSAFRGKRLGLPVLERATREAAKLGIDVLNALVHVENEASKQLFANAGYNQFDQADLPFIRMRLEL